MSILLTYLNIRELARLSATHKQLHEATRKQRNQRFLGFIISSPDGALSDEARVTYWLRKAEVARSKRSNPNTYKNLLFARSDLETDLSIAIERDLERTFPHNAYFLSGNDGYHQLQRILVAFALHNPRIGYTQGINFIAGNFLLQLEEEDAFWMLSNFLHKYSLIDLFSEGMPRLKIALYQLSCLTYIHLP